MLCGRQSLMCVGAFVPRFVFRGSIFHAPFISCQISPLSKKVICKVVTNRCIKLCKRLWAKLQSAPSLSRLFLKNWSRHGTNKLGHFSWLQKPSSLIHFSLIHVVATKKVCLSWAFVLGDTICLSCWKWTKGLFTVATVFQDDVCHYLLLIGSAKSFACLHFVQLSSQSCLPQLAKQYKFLSVKRYMVSLYHHIIHHSCLINSFGWPQSQLAFWFWQFLQHLKPCW